MGYKTLFINLSDIHVREGDSEDILQRLNSLIGYIEVLKDREECSNVIILLTGDIAYRGGVG